jgi:electron-transferring-flavoprotein dehydrogenase
MDSGMMAADVMVEALAQGREHDQLDQFDEKLRSSRVGRELNLVKNVKPLWTKLGLLGGLAAGGLDMWTREKLGFSFFGTLRHGKADHETLKPASQCQPITYPKPDGEVSFDRLTNVAFSATNHEEDQPCHLVLADKDIPIAQNLPRFSEPAQRYCPAGVYEVIENDGQSSFQINAQNCVHCKTCDIKDPSQNITWTVPEGGGGPNYPNM